MDNERALRELRESIGELTEMVNGALATKKRRLRDFDITDRGYEDRTMLRRLRDYNIDIRNPDDLDATVRNLTGVINALSARRDDLEDDIQRRRKLRVRGIKTIIEGLDSSLGISEEEREDRVSFFESAKTRGKNRRNPRIVLEELDKQIEGLEFDRHAADAMSTIIRSPRLSEHYFELLEMENKLEDEEQYRENQAQLTMNYNELCSAFMLLEKVERGLERTDLTPGQEILLARDREAAIEKIKHVFPGDENAKKRDDILGKKDDPADIDVKKVMPKLRETIEDVAFERNALNGIVDDRVLQRDKFTVQKVDYMKQLKDSYNEKDPKVRAEKQKDLLKDKDLKEFFALLEVKRMLSQLEKIENAIKTIEGKMSRITDHNSEEYKKLAKEKAEMENKYTSLKQNVFDKIGNLKLPGLSKLKLDELGAQDKRNDILGRLDKKINSEEKAAKAARKKALEKYDVNEKRGGENTKDVLGKVDAKVASIRSKYNERHAIKTRDEQDRADVEATNPADPNVNAPQTPVGTAVTPGRPGAPSPIVRGGVVPPLYGNPRGGVVNPAAPTGPAIRTSSVGSAAPGVQSQAPATTGRNPDVNSPAEQEEPVTYRPTDYKFRYLGYIKKLDSVPVQYDIQSQLDEFDRQKVEGGKVYRYEKNGDELTYLEEDLSIYLNNPKAKLNEVLDNLRYRVEHELKDKKQVDAFLHEDGKEELRELISKNPFVRRRARRDFIKDLESQGGTMQIVNMAIALNSEVTPERLNEVIGRTAQPYNRPSDMNKYVNVKKEKTFLGLGRKSKGVISENIARKSAIVESARRANSALHTRSCSDGMLRPFDISDEEIGGRRERQPRDPSRSRGDGRSR